jgi:NAD(P)-dependent dehydrogenase (short-subunit alcohol dehydrogenase family)
MILPGSAFIVTGGTGALGSATVAALLRAEARVAVPYRTLRSFDALRGAAAERQANLWGTTADVATPDAAEAFVAQATAWLGRLDGVACIAGGYAGSGPLETAPASEWTDMLRVNLDTAFATARAALPHLLTRGGSIVTVGSALAEQGGAGATAYAVSKAGVHALTRVLAAENRTRGVRVNCVIPATIDTPANRKAMPDADTSRWTPADEIARLIAFLLSPASAPVTGALIPVQGRA